MEKHTPSLRWFLHALFWFLISICIDLKFEIKAFRELREGKDYNVLIDLFWSIYHIDHLLIWDAVVDFVGIGQKSPTAVFMSSHKK